MKVIKTKDYEKFSFLNGNREINPLHLKRLKQSMQIKELESPIIVNENMEIIDGQHRFTALNELGKPIKYVIVKGYGAEEIQIYNQNQKNWKNIDFLNFHIAHGKKEYIRLDNFMAEYGLSLLQARLFAQGSGKSMNNKATEFGAGKFKFTNSDAEELAQKYCQIRHLWKFSGGRAFLIAFIAVLKNKKTEWKRLKHNALKYSYMLEKRSNSMQYIEQFQKMYNYQRKDKVFLTDSIEK